MKPKVILIEKDEDLKSVFKMMKVDMLPDSDIEGYTKNEADVQQLFKKSKDSGIRDFIMSLSGIQMIMLDDKFISLVLTVCNKPEHDWHLSMCQVIEDKSGRSTLDFVPDDMQERICNEFFDDWTPAENPGSMKVVDHFNGSQNK